MKRNTYPVAKNAQAEKFREIFKDNTSPGRVKGINNSDLISLFPNSPFIATNQSLTNDRGKLLKEINNYELGDKKTNQEETILNGPLDNETIGLMFKNVIDGYASGKSHVSREIDNDNNYNWLYRDKPMDMNFKYLDETGNSNSPNATESPVGSNAPIPDKLAPKDKPFWGHANLNVPSIDWSADRTSHFTTEGKGIPQLKRGSGGFGSSYSILNRAFESQEKIGKYFSNSWTNTSVVGDLDKEIDRMNVFAGQSTTDLERGEIQQESAKYKGDVDKDGNPI